MKNNYIVTLVFLVFFALELVSCGSIYKDQKSQLREIGYSLILPENTDIKYHAPSYDGAFANYRFSYNDGDGKNSKVEAILKEVPEAESPKSLEELISLIESKGGIINKKLNYPNGVWGCTYEKDDKKLFEFVLSTTSKSVYVLKPNETYNTEHKYLSTILTAMESLAVLEGNK